jgi:two-component system phosphate regulon response regulator OmpR
MQIKDKNINLAPHILVIDDDKRLNNLLEKFLKDNNHFVDIMMPGENGLDLLKFIRENYDTPVLMLSAMKDTKNRIIGFERGADDYLGKPFEPKELLLRIKAILRRTEENKIIPLNKSNIIKFSNIIYDPSLAIVWRNSEKIILTSKENELLNILVKGNGETIDRYVLIKNLNLESRGIDITISRLRKKIENNPKRPINILTIRGEGYALLQ